VLTKSQLDSRIELAFLHLLELSPFSAKQPRKYGTGQDVPPLMFSGLHSMRLPCYNSGLHAQKQLDDQFHMAEIPLWQK
jgi:hypothetical protein